ncbi:MAG: MurR/RpiR family transcriptional regulator [Lachnospiraceae bacterium]
MNVLQNLEELSNSQSMESIYRDLAKKILQNLDKMKRVTIYDIAELTDSSRTTVWRLVQKLGYSSFSDFRHSLQSAALQYNYYNRLIPKHINNSPQLLDHIKNELFSAAEQLAENVTDEMLNELVDEMIHSHAIRFYMPFRLALIYSLQINLAKCGKDTAYYCLLPDMLADAQTLDSNSIAVISTLEYAETLNMSSVFQELKKRGVKIWLSGASESQYEAYADRHLLDISASPSSWMFIFEGLVLAVSERLRGRFIDAKNDK